MLPEGKGWACQDPDCLQHLVVVYPDVLTLSLPFVDGAPDRDDDDPLER